MDGFFSIKEKEAMFISGILGVFIYFLFLGGEDYQNKFYYVFLGYGGWIIIKNIYWSIRASKIIKISRYDLYTSYEEIAKIRRYDENRADRIESMLFQNNEY